MRSPVVHAGRVALRSSDIAARSATGSSELFGPVVLIDEVRSFFRCGARASVRMSSASSSQYAQSQFGEFGQIRERGTVRTTPARKSQPAMSSEQPDRRRRRQELLYRGRCQRMPLDPKGRAIAPDPATTPAAATPRSPVGS